MKKISNIIFRTFYLGLSHQRPFQNCKNNIQFKINFEIKYIVYKFQNWEVFWKCYFAVKNPDLIKSFLDCHWAKRYIVTIFCIKYLTAKIVFKFYLTITISLCELNGHQHDSCYATYNYYIQFICNIQRIVPHERFNCTILIKKHALYMFCQPWHALLFTIASLDVLNYIH